MRGDGCYHRHPPAEAGEEAGEEAGRGRRQPREEAVVMQKETGSHGVICMHHRRGRLNIRIER